MKNASRACMRAALSLRPNSLSEGIQPGRVEQPGAFPAMAADNSAGQNLDHFVERDGMRFAGTHLIVDLWQAQRLDELDVVDAALRDAAQAAGATLLNINLHHFMPNGGVTGVAVLAESHISIHTWPERSYAALDIFMCGAAEPHRAAEVLKRAFSPGMITVSEHRRGVLA